MPHADHNTVPLNPSDLDDLVNLASIGLLTRGAAHTFNNVLAGIMLNAELLSLADGEQKQNLLHRIMKSAENGAALCRTLLSLTGPATAEPGPFAADSLLADVVALFQTEAHRHSITVDLSTAAGLHLAGDSARIQQLVLAVLLCALAQAGAKGHIAIVLSPGKGTVEVRISVSYGRKPAPAESRPDQEGLEPAVVRLAAARRLAGSIGATLLQPEPHQFVLRFPVASA